MAADFLHEDVVKNILIRLDVEDLIRYKSVCKSWYSLIKSSRFIKRHLTHCYNKDRCNNELGDRRIVLDHKIPWSYNLVGSSNGLVCIIYLGFTSKDRVSRSKVLVGNPLTREVRQLKRPCWDGGESVHWGFGYDSSVDDYKVVIGVLRDRDQTCFQVFSLKSSAWKVIGEVKYRFTHKVGVLCNGALHWIVQDQNYKELIISYDLSKEEFKEFPQPDDSRYACTYESCLGVIRGSICIFQQLPCVNRNVWLMKNYNVKQSWELLSYGIKGGNIVHRLMSSNNKSLFYDESLFDDFSSSLVDILGYYGLNRKWNHIDLPLFVKSLVSPHVIKGDPGPNASV